jgi:small subunit ribosomal protein S7
MKKKTDTKKTSVKKTSTKDTDKKTTKNTAPKSSEKEYSFDDIKMFNKWDSNFNVQDYGLKRYVNLRPKIIPRSAGKYQKKQFHKSKIHIVERFVLKLMVSGHSGKKHKISSGRNSESYAKNLENVEKAFEIVEKKTKQNPIEVFVRAIEKSAMREEATSFQLGGIIARKAVITSPQRRVDKVLRYMSQGIYRNCYGKKTAAPDAIAKEIVNAYKNSNDSFAIKEKERIEREAAGAR